MCSMVPHKTKRGAMALERMKAFEGVPPPYDKVKRMVVPGALQVLRLQHGHRFCRLGDLASSVSGGVFWALTQVHLRGQWQGRCLAAPPPDGMLAAACNLEAKQTTMNCTNTASCSSRRQSSGAQLCP